VARFLPQNSLDISMAMGLITHDPPTMLNPPTPGPPLLLYPRSPGDPREYVWRLSNESVEKVASHLPRCRSRSLQQVSEVSRTCWVFS
jgi:hypothetical protein